MNVQVTAIRRPEEGPFAPHTLRQFDSEDTARLDWLNANLDKFFGSPLHVVARFDGLRTALDIGRGKASPSNEQP